jgi:hypothetical protein
MNPQTTTAAFLRLVHEQTETGDRTADLGGGLSGLVRAQHEEVTA